MVFSVVRTDRIRSIMGEELTYWMIKMESGNVGFVTESASVKSTVTIIGPQRDEEVSRYQLDVDHAGYINLLNQNLTHHLDYDEAAKRVIVKGPRSHHPKAQ